MGSELPNETLVDASIDLEASPSGEVSLERGDRVGRYLVLARIGAGGMGVVYGAYDPDLDRRVAIKLLRRDLSGRHSRSDGRTALMREAQAMAKLSHPHVVTVHDVGVHEGRVFLA